MGPQPSNQGWRGKEKFMWGLSQQKAFDDLKKCLFSSLVLSLSNLQHPFEIEIYASDYDVGIFLTQHDHTMEYNSETLLYVVRKYPNYDKDMYSIMKSCFHWRHCILGKEKIIHTNDKPLKFILTQGKL
jgi:hypothetical protein